MRASRFGSAFLLFALGALAPFGVRAQTRELVSKAVSVGRSSASLELEFADGGTIEIAFEDGSVLLDERSVGTYQAGDALDAAWRSLLGQAVALDDGALAEALAEWTAPAELTGEAATIAARLDGALEDAVRPPERQADRGPTSDTRDDASSLIRFLTGSARRLSVIEEALGGLDRNLRVHVDEDAVVSEGETFEGDLVVIDGDARIAGRVEGDVVVIGGEVELLEGSSVTGELRLVDASLVENEGSVSGGVIDVGLDERELEESIRDELRNEVRIELRRELRDEARERGGGSALFAPFRAVASGVGGVLEHLMAVFVLALVGAAVMAFGGTRLDLIAETARRAPTRAAAVGFAGTVLLIPVWLLGFIALLVTIIGIPLAIAWLPLFPLAAMAAGIVGYLAVARNAGEWLADSGYPWTDWIRKSNPLMTMVGGLLALALLFIAGHVLSMVPLFGVLHWLLMAMGVVVTFVAAEIGLGAVILTRAGRRREPAPYGSSEAWDAAMNVDLDDLDSSAEPTASGGDGGPDA